MSIEPERAAPAAPRQRLHPLTLAAKATGALMMLASILTVLFGAWAISDSPELTLLCMAVWVGGFTLFIVARTRERKE